MKRRLLWLFTAGGLFSLIVFSFSQNNIPDERTLRRYAISHLFYHYDLNDIFERPIRIVGDTLIVRKDSTRIYFIPMDKFNYFFVNVLKVKYKGYDYIVVVDLCTQKPETDGLSPDSSLSLVGKSIIFLSNSKNFTQDFKDGAEFYNNLFENGHLTYSRLVQQLGRTPHFFTSIDTAYQVILNTLPLIRRCEGGGRIIEGGISMCPEEKSHRIIYFNKLTSVKILDLLPVISDPDSIIKNNIFLEIGRQIGEKDNAVMEGDSTFLITLYEIPRKYQEEAYRLEDALIFMAVY